MTLQVSQEHTQKAERWREQEGRGGRDRKNEQQEASIKITSVHPPCEIGCEHLEFQASAAASPVITAFVPLSGFLQAPRLSKFRARSVVKSNFPNSLQLQQRSPHL
eukprot:601727-Hanusia_phi.AAC.2